MSKNYTNKKFRARAKLTPRGRPWSKSGSETVATWLARKEERGTFGPASECRSIPVSEYLAELEGKKA